MATSSCPPYTPPIAALVVSGCAPVVDNVTAAVDDVLAAAMFDGGLPAPPPTGPTLSDVLDAVEDNLVVLIVVSVAVVAEEPRACAFSTGSR